MVSFIDVLITVVFMLLLAVPGYLFAKAKMFPAAAGEAFSTLVLYGCQSVLIVMSFQNCAYSPKIGLNMLIVALLSVALYFLFFIFLKLLFLKRAKVDKFRILKYTSVFSNCGFMGVPFLQSLFSQSDIQSELLIYSAVIIALFQVFNWTIGVYILTGDKKEISVKKILLNPVIVAIFIGLIMFFVVQKPMVELCESGTIGYKILSKLTASLNYISNMVTPLSMIVMGIRLADINLKELFMDKWAYVSVAIKLVIIPLTVIFCVSFLPISSAIKYTIFFLLAMPSATSAVMMAVKYGKDGDFASVCVLLSTLLSVATLPPLYYFMNVVLNIPL